MNTLNLKNRRRFLRFTQLTFSIFLLFILLLTIFLSLVIGHTVTPISEVIDAVFNYKDENSVHVAIFTTRLSRTLISALVGSALAVAGLLMQSLTRNPMASPSIFGINAGAIFFIVFALVVLGINSMETLLIFAFLGATATALLVLLLGSLNQKFASPTRLVLAGAALSALFMSFTQGFLVLNENNLETVLFWMGGSSTSRNVFELYFIAVIMVIAMMVPLFMVKQLSLLRYGDEMSVALGQNIKYVKGIMIILIIILAGSSVALAGFIGFVGLVVPHIARYLARHDFKYAIIYCVILGATFVISADIFARFIISPRELPVGALTTLIGIPFFISIIRRDVDTL